MTRNRLFAYSLIVAVVLVSSGLLSGVLSGFDIFDNNSFAQTFAPSTDGSVSAPAPAGGDTNETVQFNRYENSDLGITLKYPSNFLIDDSNSDEKLQQIVFFPPSNTSMTPEHPILWMGVFIQALNPISNNSSSSPYATPSHASNLNIETYAESLANSIQRGNKDIAIIEKSTNTLLSGHPAYKLVTQSYYNNSAIIDVQIGTIFNNKHYSINYMTELSNYFNSLPVSSAIIQSFDINELAPITSNLKQFGSEPDPSSTASTGSFLGSILSYFKLDDFSNKPSGILNKLETSITNSVNNILNSSGNQVPSSDLNSLKTSLTNSVNNILNSSGKSGSVKRLEQPKDLPHKLCEQHPEQLGNQVPSSDLNSLKTSLTNSVNNILNSSGNQVPANVLSSLKTSLTNSVNNILNSSKSEINKSLVTPSLPPQSSLPSQTMEQVCHLPLLSKVCGVVVGGSGDGSSVGSGGNVSNSGAAAGNATSFNNGSVRESLEKSLNSIMGLLELPGSSTR